MELIIFADGGCHNNGSPNARAYGSYAVQHEGKTVRQEQMPFPMINTNNQAEYTALMRVIDYLLGFAQRYARCSTVTVRIQMDSALVVNQVNGAWRVKDPDLSTFCSNARTGLDVLRKTYNSIELVQVDRSVIVKMLGH